MKEYQVVTSHAVAALVTQVNRLIQIGWEPIGGITAAPVRADGLCQYLQAMIKA